MPYSDTIETMYAVTFSNKNKFSFIMQRSYQDSTTNKVHLLFFIFRKPLLHYYLKLLHLLKCDALTININNELGI